MLTNDLLRLPPSKLTEMAAFLGLEQRGARGIWIVRKSITDPASKKVRQFKRSTKTVDLRTAVLRATPWVEEFMARSQDGLGCVVADPNKCATVGAVLDFYEIGGTGQKATRRKNVNDLESMLQMMFPASDVRQLSTRVIDGKFARNWQQAVKDAAGKRCLPHDVEGFERAKRGANTKLGHAQSVFSKRNRLLYQDGGMNVAPEVREFAETLNIEDVAEAPAPQMLSEAMVSKIVEALPELKRTRPGTWACVLLMFQAGLRNIEAEKARWQWLSEDSDSARLNLSTADDYTPKGRDGIVLLAPQVVAALRSVRPVNHEYLVPARTPSERRDICHRDVNTFLAECGVEKLNGKIAYRLRGHAISRIILEHGLDAGQEFGRHKSRATTQQYYKGVAMPYQPIAPLPGIGLVESTG